LQPYPVEPPVSQDSRRAASEAGAGFTLIELVIVLVVLGVAGVMAAPAIQPALDSVRAEAAVRRTASFLDDARRRAVLERRVLVVHCRPEEGRLELLGAAAGERAFQLPEAVAIVSCLPEEMRYFPQGSATGMTLLLRDRRGRERSLAVGTFTGLSRVDAAR
jgi:prepilin-type N-terminal cleavage/methylation domain-containing protein